MGPNVIDDTDGMTEEEYFRGMAVAIDVQNDLLVQIYQLRQQCARLRDSLTEADRLFGLIEIPGLIHPRDIAMRARAKIANALSGEQVMMPPN
ncbi:MAG: hypothetical protein KJZ90_05630 [Rhodocyclaceae bacterium]|nr:hypothetical protein [Rhodocyclaceae bacterium]